MRLLVNAPKRRWFAFALRMLFVVVTVMVGCLAWLCIWQQVGRRQPQIDRQRIAESLERIPRTELPKSRTETAPVLEFGEKQLVARRSD